MGVDRGSLRAPAAFVQMGRIGQSHIDPGQQPPGQVVNPDRGFVPGCHALSEADALGVFQAVGEQAHEEVVGAFGRFPSHAQVERFVDAAVDVSEFDG